MRTDAISPLRRRMIEDMTVRNLSPHPPPVAYCPATGGGGGARNPTRPHRRWDQNTSQQPLSTNGSRPLPSGDKRGIVETLAKARRNGGPQIDTS